MALTKVIGAGIGTVTNQFSDANMASGSVVQVGHQTTSGSSSSTASSSITSYTDSGLSVSITPTSTSNKILVFGSFCVGVHKASVGTSARIDLRLVNSDASETAYEQRYVGTDYQGSGNLSVLDTFHGYFTPSSTSSQTYKVQVRVAAGDSSAAHTITLLWYTNAKHTMTAMEIVG